MRLELNYGEKAVTRRHPRQEESLEIGVLIQVELGMCERPRVYNCTARFFFLSSSLTAACRETQGQVREAERQREREGEGEREKANIPTHPISSNPEQGGDALTRGSSQ